MAFKNFRIWRGRLPHWRASDVLYYVTFRHRRDLDEDECFALLRCLLKSDGAKYEIVIAVVRPNESELMFTIDDEVELSKIVEGAKRRAGKVIIKKTGERFSPFFDESYDRIVRDEEEYRERLESMANSVDEDWAAKYHV